MMRQGEEKENKSQLSDSFPQMMNTEPRKLAGGWAHSYPSDPPVPQEPVQEACLAWDATATPIRFNSHPSPRD